MHSSTALPLLLPSAAKANARGPKTSHHTRPYKHGIHSICEHACQALPESLKHINSKLRRCASCSAPSVCA